MAIVSETPGCYTDTNMPGMENGAEEVANSGDEVREQSDQNGAQEAGEPALDMTVSAGRAAPAIAIQAVYNRRQLRALGVLSFLALTFFIFRWILEPSTLVPLERPFPRGMVSVALGVYLGVFAFILFPQNVREKRFFGTLSLAGPPALIATLCFFFLKLLPSSEGVSTRYFRVNTELQRVPMKAFDLKTSNVDVVWYRVSADGALTGVLLRFPAGLPSIDGTVSVSNHASFDCTLAPGYADGTIDFRSEECN